MISKDINRAAELLCNEEIVAIPTETVYGLAGNIFSEKSIKSIFELKKRPTKNPLIVHIGSKNQLIDLTTEIPDAARKLIDKFWPGSLTLVLKKREVISDLITGGKDTVAVRMPHHEQTLKLLELLPFPLAAPSANPFGSISPTSADHVANYFHLTIPMILDGGICENGIESTIIGFENEVPVLYRLGAISLEEIENEIGPVTIKNFEEQNPNAPGMLKRHYAPKTSTIVTDNLYQTLNCNQGKKIGLLTLNSKIDNATIFHHEILSPTSNLKEAATNLYAALHRLDNLELDIIITEEFPNNQLGRAINDRLKRATQSKN